MTDQFDHDPFDRRLTDALRRRSGRPVVSASAAHRAVVARAGRIKRRRTIAAPGGGTLAVARVGAIALVPRGGDDALAPGDSIESGNPSTVRM
jgi:hypothetical protein